MAATAIRHRSSSTAMALRARQAAATASSLGCHAFCLRETGPVGSVFCPRATRGTVPEKNNTERGRVRFYRAGILNKGRSLLPRLAFWGARRAIPAVRGPETESWPHHVVAALGARVLLQPRYRDKHVRGSAEIFTARSYCSQDPTEKRLREKMRFSPRNGRFAQYHLLGLLRSARHAMPALAPGMG